MLASSAEDIQLWDVRCPLPEKEEINNSFFQPTKKWISSSSQPKWSQISDLVWSHSANTISCAPSKFGGIVFCSIDKSVDGDRPQCKKEIVGHRCVDIGEKDRLLVTAGQDSNLYLYSMTRCKLWQVFKGHNGNVTSAVFNANSSHIASGSDKGEIILSNISTRESTAPLLAPRVQIINKLSYNPHKSSILGSVTSDGAVNIWDAGRAKLLQSANQIHTASATDLAFFNDNQHLLVTVGLDGKLALIDTNNFNLVSVTTMKSGITCVDVGGDVIALGTKQGSVYLYDSRNMKTPFAQKENAHKTAVNCIKFRNLEEKLSLLSQSLGNLSQTSSFGHKNSPKSTEKSGGKVESKCGRRMSSTPKDYSALPPALDISNMALEVSPSRNNHEAGINFEEYGLFSPESQHNSICPSGSSLDQSGISYTRLSGASLMWPSIMNPGEHADSSIHRINNSPHLEQSSANYVHFTDEEKLSCTSNVYSQLQQDCGRNIVSPPGHQNIPGLPQGKSFQLPLTPDQIPIHNTSDPDPARQLKQLSPLPRMNQENSPPMQTAPENQWFKKSQSVTFLKENNSSNNYQDSSSLKSSNVEKTLSADALSSTNDRATTKTSQLQVYPSPKHSINPVGSSHSPSGLSSSTVTPSNAFSFKLLNSVVQDAMEEFTDQIHNDFLCMQMNILHMFQQQQAELRYDLQQQLSIVKELVVENRQLKLENKQLRKNY